MIDTNFWFVVTGLAYLCEGLKEQRKGLVTLVLWNNQLTHSGMGYLAAALVFIYTHTRTQEVSVMMTSTEKHKLVRNLQRKNLTLYVVV